MKSPKVEPRIRSVYADDSACEIDGRKHTLLGALAFQDDAAVIAKMLNCKAGVGLGPNDEIKWNSKKYPREQRELISNAVMPILQSGKGFLVVHESGKQAAAIAMASQISDYCRAVESPGFVCHFDREIITDPRTFDSHAYSLSPPCAGWSEMDSAHSQLIQCADLFVGFQKLKIDIGTGRVDPQKPIQWKRDDGHLGPTELSFHLFASFRYSLWGKDEVVHWAQIDDLAHMKTNLGYGLRIFSSVSEKAINDATAHLRRDYMGCIH